MEFSACNRTKKKKSGVAEEWEDFNGVWALRDRGNYPGLSFCTLPLSSPTAVCRGDLVYVCRAACRGTTNRLESENKTSHGTAFQPRWCVLHRPRDGGKSRGPVKEEKPEKEAVEERVITGV